MAAKKASKGEIKGFDLLESPLEGTNLIEASAGTGKTYTIAGLFLRLILEKGFSVNDILVVTYTVAATEELRDRIRKKIREAMEAFSAGSSPDEFLNGLVQKNPDPQGAIRLLQEALHDFDEASIFTIHGFCQRTLHESAFESGSLFDTELLPDQERLKEEIVRDFWRLHFYRTPLEFVAYAQSKSVSPRYFLNLLRKGTAHLDSQIVPEIKSAKLTSLEAFRRVAENLKGEWPKAREEILRIFSGPALKYYTNPQKHIEAMDGYVANGAGLPLFKEFEKFTPDRLAAGTKKNCVTPKHPFFDLCEDFQEKATALASEMDRQILFLKRELFRYLQKELPARKERQNIQSFDDLLIRLRDALEKTGGDDLAKAIRTRYRAALIDEFQDTDPVQYAIFKSVFRGEESILFLIGDPKQAIYSFRGADLFAYMRAAGHVDSRYTLTKNWRSEPGLITAVNTIFSNGKKPFIYEDIPFEPSTAKERREQDSLKINKKAEPPFHLWFVDAKKVADSDKPITKGQARELIPDAVAGEISRLIGLGKEGRALIGDRPLREADIAVLVRRNSEARLVQESLTALRIPSVLHSMGNLFDTDEALEMSRVLSAIGSPNHEPLLKVSLATDMLGKGGEDLEKLGRDEAEWEDWVVKFREYNELWEKRGFIRMFRYFLLKEKVRTRLLSFPDGERRLTNIIHLAEVLHQESSERKLGMVGLLKWLRQQRDPESPRLEEHQLRLESDANAVRIVTIHKSKGLEYPVVFCPFNWDGSEIGKKEEFLFHDPKDDWKINLVLNPEENPNRMLGEKEILAENLRLLYVSLTRAKNRCYLIWGRFNEAGTSAPAYLLHPADGSPEDIVAATGEKFEGLTDADIRQALKELARNGKGAIQLSDMPLGPGEQQLPAAEAGRDLHFQGFSAHIRRDWRIASFSLLTADREKETKTPSHAAIDLPEHDQGINLEETISDMEPSGIFAFPKGARPGTLLHDIFEQIDFSGKDISPIREVVAGKLREYGFEMHWQETVCEMIGKVLAAPLQSGENGLTLSRIGMKDRLSELEFYFPLDLITPKKLKKVFADHGGPEIAGDFPEQIENLNFLPAQGFMKGFIDLVFQFQGRFYLVDWKSNFLGNRVEDYGKKTLLREMKENFYILQYHIYTLALHQYLRNRLGDYDYEKHFGGVFYVFLRGVDPERGPDFGIYRDLPRKELVEALSRELIGQP
jgi:exodeoxyribonuclease V beta subunit